VSLAPSPWAIAARAFAQPARPADSPPDWPGPSDLAAEMFPGYIPAPHLVPIDDAYRACRDGTADRLLICTPPQVGKSTTASEAGPLWWLHNRPTDRVVVASYAAALAERRGRKVRNVITEHAARLDLRLTGDSRAASRWDLSTGGGMLCMGVGGGLTGNPANLAIVDDPHKDRPEANSSKIRDTVWDWWTSTLLTRIQPGGAVILIMTRWHPDDLAARVLATEGRWDEGGRWRVVSLPAIAEADGDDLGRAEGDPLTHPKLPGASRETLLAFWAGKRREVQSEWTPLYQQRPTAPEGAVWQWAWIAAGRRKADEMPRLARTIVSIDPSVTSGENADECGITVVARGVDGDGYVLDDRTLRATPLDWATVACRAAVEWDADEFVAESNQGQEMVTLTLRTAWDRLRGDGGVRGRLMPGVKLVNARKGKRLRASPVAALYEAGRVHHVGPSLDLLENELTGWTGEGDSPNRLDSVVHGVTHLLAGGPQHARSVSVAAMQLPPSGPRGRY